MNESSIEDSIEIEVNNYGMSQQSITYYLYLPQNIDVLDFSSKKIETSFLGKSSKIKGLRVVILWLSADKLVSIFLELKSNTLIFCGKYK